MGPTDRHVDDYGHRPNMLEEFFYHTTDVVVLLVALVIVAAIWMRIFPIPRPNLAKGVIATVALIVLFTLLDYITERPHQLHHSEASIRVYEA